MLHSIIVNALVVKDGKILISQRGLNEDHDPGKWTIPGGKVDQTEGNIWNVLERTAVREVAEEVGLKVDSIELITNNTFVRTGGQHVVAIVCICEWAEGIARPAEDTNDVAWITENDLDSYDFSPNVKKYLRQGFNRLSLKSKAKSA